MLLAFLAACASTPNEITRNKPVSSFPPENGLIVGSFTSDEDIYARRFFFRNIQGTGETNAISFTPGFFQAGLFSEGSAADRTSHYAFSLPPGEYEFFNFKLAYHNGYAGRSWEAKQDFSIPFTVAAGEISYLGQIRCYQLTGKNIFGISIPAGGVFEISDRFGNDVPSLKAKFPEFDWSTLVNRTTLSGDVPEGLITFRRLDTASVD